MGSEGLSNLYLLRILNHCKLQRFRGVFSCDTIPRHIARQKHFTIICNLEEAGEPGSHFVAIVGKLDVVIYADPLGGALTAAAAAAAAVDTLKPQLVKFLAAATAARDRELVFEVQAVQHPQSAFCGFHAMLQVLYHDVDDHNLQIVYHRQDLRKNDIIVIKLIKKFICMYMTRGRNASHKK
jgi:hypothetical protein